MKSALCAMEDENIMPKEGITRHRDVRSFCRQIALCILDLGEVLSVIKQNNILSFGRVQCHDRSVYDPIL
jgi:hypothetical protein